MERGDVYIVENCDGEEDVYKVVGVDKKCDLPTLTAIERLVLKGRTQVEIPGIINGKKNPTSSYFNLDELGSYILVSLPEERGFAICKLEQKEEYPYMGKIFRP